MLVYALGYLALQFGLDSNNGIITIMLIVTHPAGEQMIEYDQEGR